VDQKLAYQQNLTVRKIAVLVLSTNNWAVIQEQADKIQAAIEETKSEAFRFLDIGHGRG
jgi:hypothetical protein